MLFLRIKHWHIDYVYMCTNNVIISNNQSKDLIVLPCTCNFPYSYYSLRIVVIFTAVIRIPHFTALMMDSERAGVLLAVILIYLHLMHNDFVWLYSRLFRRHRNVIEFVCLLPSLATRRFCMRVINRDWWQRVVCILSPNLRINTGACHVLHICHKRMRTMVRAATLWLRCLHACIFWLKSAYATYINMIMLAVIMSLIALFRSKYCVSMR